MTDRFDEAKHIAALDDLTRRRVIAERKGRTLPDREFDAIDVGTVRMLRQRARTGRDVGFGFLEMIGPHTGAEQATQLRRLSAAALKRAERTDRTADELMASLPLPVAQEALEKVAFDEHGPPATEEPRPAEPLDGGDICAVLSSMSGVPYDETVAIVARHGSQLTPARLAQIHRRLKERT